MKLVLDSVPLIYLAKIRFFELTNRLDVQLYTSEEVKAEVLDGKSEETSYLQEQFKTEAIKTRKGKTLQGKGLHAGEATALGLAKELGATFVSDDRLALAYAKTQEIDAMHTTFLLLRAISKKALSKKDAVAALDKMVFLGWRCDTETYARIRRKIEEHE